MRPDWQEPIAVLGYGVEGKSTLRHLQRWNFHDIVVLDSKAPTEALPAGVQGFFGDNYLKGLQKVKTAIRSPGLRPFFVPEIVEFQNCGGILTSQVEAAFAPATHMKSVDARHRSGALARSGIRRGERPGQRLAPVGWCA